MLVTEIPNVNSLRSEAFKSASVYSGLENPALYPVSENIAFIFENENMEDSLLAFPKFVKYFYDSGEKNFIAVGKTGKEFDVYVRKGKNFKYYEFDGEEAVMGIVSTLLRYADDKTLIAAMDDEKGEVKRAVTEAIKVTNEKKKASGEEPIPMERVTFASVNVTPKDRENLITKKSLKEILNEKLKRLRASLSGGNERGARGEKPKKYGSFFLVIFASVAAVGIGYYLYEKYLSEVRHEDDAMKKVEDRKVLLEKNFRNNASRIEFVLKSVSDERLSGLAVSSRYGAFLTGKPGVCDGKDSVEITRTSEIEFCHVPSSGIPKAERRVLGFYRKSEKTVDLKKMKKAGVEPLVFVEYPNGRFLSFSTEKASQTNLRKILRAFVKGDSKTDVSVKRNGKVLTFSVREEKWNIPSGTRNRSSKSKTSGKRKIVLGG